MNTASLLTKCKSLLAKSPSLLPKRIRLVEVGPRDGLQNESAILDVDFKIKMIEGLISCGVQHIETGAFVSPKWVPQMASSAEVLRHLQGKGTVPKDVVLSVLVPNMKGMDKG